MSHEGESSKRVAKKRKRDKLAILAAFKKNKNAAVKISSKLSGGKHFSHEESSGGDIVRSSHSKRSGTRKKITKSKNVKKKKKIMKGKKNTLPSEDSCEEVYTDDDEFRDREFRNDDNSDKDSTEKSTDGSSSEEDESIPNSPTRYNKRSKQKSKQAMIREWSNEAASEDEQDDREQDSPNGSSKDNPSTKESHKSQMPRGSTHPPAVLDSSLKKKVIFNESGQPIGENSIAYSSELGSIARDMVLLTYDDWRSVDKGHKDIYWDTVLKKFTMDEALGKIYTLQSIGKLWRARKSRLRRKIKAYEKNNEDIQTLMPHGASDAEWAYFVRKQSNKAFKKKSKKYRDTRKKQNLPHTCGRRGYARLAEKMRSSPLSTLM